MTDRRAQEAVASGDRRPAAAAAACPPTGDAGPLLYPRRPEAAGEVRGSEGKRFRSVPFLGRSPETKLITL